MRLKYGLLIAGIVVIPTLGNSHYDVDKIVCRIEKSYNRIGEEYTLSCHPSPKQPIVLIAVDSVHEPTTIGDIHISINSDKEEECKEKK